MTLDPASISLQITSPANPEQLLGIDPSSSDCVGESTTMTVASPVNAPGPLFVTVILHVAVWPLYRAVELTLLVADRS